MHGDDDNTGNGNDPMTGDFCFFLQQHVTGNFKSMSIDKKDQVKPKLLERKVISQSQLEKLKDLSMVMANKGQPMNLKMMLMADNQSTINLFCNQNY